ncbi:hypothetical protein QJN67_29130, partial [Escherichia coli]
LVEAAWSYRHPARISPAIQKRQENLPRPVIDRAWDAQLRLCKENLPRPVIDRAWDAQLRLCKRYRKLQAKGKNVNITIVAVAR